MLDTRLTSRAWVEVDLDAVANNVKRVKEKLPSGTLFLAVVKANAYGHGALSVANAALEAGADWLAVATAEEGLKLREGGIKAPILILGLSPDEFANDIVRADLTAAICTEQGAIALAEAGERQGKKAMAHLKIDTGMGRIGLREKEVVPFLQHLKELSLPWLKLDGIFTHLATADADDKSHALEQFATFQRVIGEAETNGFHFSLRHAANSAATLYLPQTALDMVRFGISLYGMYPSGKKEEGPLVPVLQFKTRVYHIKTIKKGQSVSYGRTYIATEDEKIATLAIGYADGYSRDLSNKGEVIIRGRVVPIIGRVCMDQCMVRIPSDLPVEVGDEAILIGKQGSVEITADDVAEKQGTISYEVFTSISPRVKRVYIKGGDAV